MCIKIMYKNPKNLCNILLDNRISMVYNVYIR